MKTKAIGALPENVREEIKKYASLYGIKKAVLFGSRARGNPRERSDIDILADGGDVDGFRLALDEEAGTWRAAGTFPGSSRPKSGGTESLSMRKFDNFLRSPSFLKTAAALAALVLCAACASQRGREDFPPDFVFVEGGTFRMGSESGDGDEKPVHAVTVAPFHICDHEVTQAEWHRVMGANPSAFKGGGRPVENVSWLAAIEYCNRRSEAEGLSPCYSGIGGEIECDFSANGYRLPTEAEWEFAARGGNLSENFDYSGSDSPEDVAWHCGNSGNETHGVRRKLPNGLGLYDMSGNVWEWCWDRYDGEYYGKSPSRDPRGAPSGEGRVLRGGCWGNNAPVCRAAFRHSGSPGFEFHDLGLRVVRTR